MHVVTKRLKMAAGVKEISCNIQMHKTKSSQAVTFPEWSRYFKVNCNVVQFLLMAVDMCVLNQMKLLLIMRGV